MRKLRIFQKHKKIGFHTLFLIRHQPNSFPNKEQTIKNSKQAQKPKETRKSIQKMPISLIAKNMKLLRLGLASQL